MRLGATPKYTSRTKTCVAEPKGEPSRDERGSAVAQASMGLFFVLTVHVPAVVATEEGVSMALGVGFDPIYAELSVGITCLFSMALWTAGRERELRRLVVLLVPGTPLAGISMLAAFDLLWQMTDALTASLLGVAIAVTVAVGLASSFLFEGLPKLRPVGLIIFSAEAPGP